MIFLFENPDGGDKSMPLTEFRQQEIMPREIILAPHSETIVYAEPQCHIVSGNHKGLPLHGP